MPRTLSPKTSGIERILSYSPGGRGAACTPEERSWPTGGPAIAAPPGVGNFRCSLRTLSSFIGFAWRRHNIWPPPRRRSRPPVLFVGAPRPTASSPRWAVPRSGAECGRTHLPARIGKNPKRAHPSVCETQSRERERVWREPAAPRLVPHLSEDVRHKRMGTKSPMDTLRALPPRASSKAATAPPFHLL